MHRSDGPFEGLTSALEPNRSLVRGVSSTRHKGDGARTSRSMYENWFLEDTARSLPYGRGIDEGFRLTSDSTNQSHEKLILNALPTALYGHERLADGFRDFLQSCTFNLLQGNLYLYIEYFHRGSIYDDPPQSFRIHILPSESVTKIRGKYRQSIEIEDDRSVICRRVIPLQTKCLVTAKLSSQLAKTVKRTIDLLREISEHSSVATDFVVGEHGQDTGFEVRVHQQLLNDLVLRETRDIGWTGRGTFADGLLDPEKAWRAIQFTRFQLVVRDIVLSALQKAVDRSGSVIGFESKLMLSGVLTHVDLDRFEADLRQGSRPILDLMYPKKERMG